MFSLLRQSVSAATLFQLVAEICWLFLAILLALRLDGSVMPHEQRIMLALIFAVSIT